MSDVCRSIMEDTQRLDDFLWALAKKITNEIHYTDLSKALMTMGEVEGAALHTHRNQGMHAPLVFFLEDAL